MSELEHCLAILKALQIAEVSCCLSGGGDSGNVELNHLLYADGRYSRMPAVSPVRLAAASARHFGTAPDALLPLHSWFLETETWFSDARHFAMRHSSFGIFQAEQCFGVVLGRDTPSPTPTRVAAEWHVRTVLGRIPAAADYLRRIKGQPWMAAAHKAYRRGLR